MPILIFPNVKVSKCYQVLRLTEANKWLKEHKIVLESSGSFSLASLSQALPPAPFVSPLWLLLVRHCLLCHLPLSSLFCLRILYTLSSPFLILLATSFFLWNSSTSFSSEVVCPFKIKHSGYPEAKPLTSCIPGLKLNYMPQFSLVAQSCLTLWDPMDCSLPGSSVHAIFQARVLEWAAISFSRGSSWPRDWTQASHNLGRHLTVWATREVQIVKDFLQVTKDSHLFALTKWV